MDDMFATADSSLPGDPAPLVTFNPAEPDFSSRRPRAAGLLPCSLLAFSAFLITRCLTQSPSATSGAASFFNRQAIPTPA